MFLRITETDGELEFLKVYCHRRAIIDPKLEIDRGDFRSYELDRGQQGLTRP